MKKNILTMLLAIFLVSCASKMPLSQKDFSLTHDEGLGVFVITTNNDYTKTGLQPKLLTVQSRTGSFKETFSFSKPIKNGENSYQSLASVNLPAGNYTFNKLKGTTDLEFILILPSRGFFDQNLNKNFTINPGQVNYLGHLTATLAKRSSDSEQRAGPLIPIMDQLKTGMYKGTLKYRISDSYNKDISLLKNSFQFLNNKKIVKSLMQ